MISGENSPFSMNREAWGGGKIIWKTHRDLAPLKLVFLFLILFISKKESRSTPEDGKIYHKITY